MAEYSSSFLFIKFFNRNNEFSKVHNEETKVLITKYSQFFFYKKKNTIYDIGFIDSGILNYDKIWSPISPWVKSDEGTHLGYRLDMKITPQFCAACLYDDNHHGNYTLVAKVFDLLDNFITSSCYFWSLILD